MKGGSALLHGQQSEWGKLKENKRFYKRRAARPGHGYPLPCHTKQHRKAESGQGAY